MEYLVLIYRDESREGEADQAERGRGYERYATALARAGVMRGGRKLQTSDAATTVTVRAGEPLVCDGPAIQGREQLGGYFVLECVDLDEAVRWAALCPGSAEGTVEVRPVSA
ncbi:YciI family protein [Streptomyces mirabilis]|uniref:YciI family protein n=1 Tax=Streptomyces mirabilis TaxID=68239 RepID=UPI0036573275